jgi:xanthine/CO dehydrogenase XdhC/CoxF family maturation factor
MERSSALYWDQETVSATASMWVLERDHELGSVSGSCWDRAMAYESAKMMDALSVS